MPGALTFDRQAEERYAAMRLDFGEGDRASGRLCVMSLAAYLADEAHSDRPGTASELVADFAIHLNDAMPVEWRERLKPFAPIIVGTRDRADSVRAQHLLAMVASRILPLIQRELVGSPTWGARLLDGLRIWRLNRAARRLLMRKQDPTAPLGLSIGTATARILIRAARSARGPAEAGLFWATALSILDDLCSFRSECDEWDRDPDSSLILTAMRRG